MNIGYKRKGKKTDIAQTLMARDYKGMSNQGITTIIVKDKS